MEYWRSEVRTAEREQPIRFVVRMDPGDEIINCLTMLQEQEKFGFAQVIGLAAVDEVEIGVFDVGEKVFRGNTFKGTFEVSNLTANLTMMEGQPYVHAHMTFGDESGRAYGGHLVRARISATGEFMVQGWHDIRPDEDVGRRFDGGIGLNLLQFSGEQA